MKHGAIYTEAPECRDCFKCVRECGVKAIKIEDAKAEIIDHYCTYCGTCFRVCPGKAKKVRDDLEDARSLVSNGNTILLLAPSFRAEFSSKEGRGILQKVGTLGFRAVYDASTAASLINREYRSLFVRSKGLIIASACPTVVMLVQRYYPRLLPALAPVRSPMSLQADLLRKKFGNDVSIIFAGPCVSKKVEAEWLPKSADVVIGFDALRRWIQEEKVHERALKVPGDKSYGYFDIISGGGDGALYPSPGGMIQGMPYLDDVGYSALHYSGMESVREILKGAESCLDEPLFLELLACREGCINGPLASGESSILTKQLAMKESVCTMLKDEQQEKKASVEYGIRYSNEAVDPYNFSVAITRKALADFGKHTKEDELNCSGCGYESCRAFAEAYMAGYAEVEMCVSFMRQRAHRKAHALIETFPSGVLIVDAQLKVVECNRPCIELLGGDLEEIYNSIGSLAGVSLRKKISFYNYFQSALQGSGESFQKDVSYNNRVLNVTLFTVEPNQLVGAILQDVTNPVVQRARVVANAEEVIRKTSKTVQQIAYLLGENAAESEAMLQSIVKLYSSNG